MRIFISISMFNYYHYYYCCYCGKNRMDDGDLDGKAVGSACGPCWMDRFAETLSLVSSWKI